MEFLELRTIEEMWAFLNIARQQKNLFNNFAHVGGVSSEGANKHSWFWIDSGNRIQFDLNWAFKEPNNKHGGTEYCLSIKKLNGGFGFNDIRCSNFKSKFLCSKDDVSQEDESADIEENDY